MMTMSRQTAFNLLMEAGYPSDVIYKVLPNGKIAWVHPLLFTYAILVASADSVSCEYEDRWCFTDKGLAVAALEHWSTESEPEGWIRNPRTGRRRPDGDESREYVDF